MCIFEILYAIILISTEIVHLPPHENILAGFKSTNVIIKVNKC